MSIPDDLPLIEFDYRLFEHVLSNLLINGATYSPPHTEISLSAKINLGLLIITVEDHGPGIPESSIPYVFEKFYRVPGTPAGGDWSGLVYREKHCRAARRDDFGCPWNPRWIVFYPFTSAKGAAQISSAG